MCLRIFIHACAGKCFWTIFGKPLPWTQGVNDIPSILHLRVIRSDRISQGDGLAQRIMCYFDRDRCERGMGEGNGNIICMAIAWLSSIDSEKTHLVPPFDNIGPISLFYIMLSPGPHLLER